MILVLKKEKEQKTGTNIYSIVFDRNVPSEENALLFVDLFRIDNQVTLDLIKDILREYPEIGKYICAIYNNELPIIDNEKVFDNG
jgi:hypothetical protein